MRRLLRSIPIVIAFSLAVLSAATAVAAPASWERVDVTMHAEQDGSVLLVSGALPEDTKLPAEAELSAPAGAELQWIGEILGGPSAEDPELKYTKTSADGVDVYRFTLTKAKVAQAEFPTTSGQLFDGTTYTSSVEWTATQDTPEVRLSVRVPDGAKPVVPPVGAVLMPGDSGYSFYTKTVRNVKAGDKLDLKMAYTAPSAGSAPAAVPAAAGSSNTDAAALAVVIVIIAFAAGAFVLMRRKRGAAPAAAQQSSANSAPRATDSTDADDADGAVEPVAGGGMSGAAKRKLVTVTIIGVLILGTAIVGAQTTKPKTSGDAITEVFAQGEACATASIPLSVPDGADAAATAKTVFDVLRPIANTATFNVKTSSVSVGFCDSTSSESAIKAAIAPTGLLAD